jgi:hypothetical protein
MIKIIQREECLRSMFAQYLGDETPNGKPLALLECTMSLKYSALQYTTPHWVIEMYISDLVNLGFLRLMERTRLGRGGFMGAQFFRKSCQLNFERLTRVGFRFERLYLPLGC